ncbi:uncharacterized protein [Ambystoma mexicanum]|uniref:uncharacterized protein n=1 Tax=Ambystoma mexicanum TaxID=8296 RepID=UPI0037E7BB83
MLHPNKGNLSQVLRSQFNFLYPVPPYMSMRLRMKQETTFSVHPQIHMLQSFEWTDLIATHPYRMSSSGTKHKNFASQNNMPISRSANFNRGAKISTNAMRSYGGTDFKETLNNYEEKDRSRFISKQNMEFRHFNQYKAKVKDKNQKELFRDGRTVVAKPVLQGEGGTMDIHQYSVSGNIAPNRLANHQSISILDKLLKDPVSMSILQNILGDSHSVSELHNFLSDSKPTSEAISGNRPHYSKKVTEALESLSKVNKLPIALNFTGTNFYLACTENPPLLSLEEPNANDLQTIEDSEKRFIFWQDIENGACSFESELHQNYYISTSMSDEGRQVKLLTDPERQSAISEFKVIQ